MPNTSEIYRQNAILEYQNQLKAKLARQHVQREGEVPMYVPFPNGLIFRNGNAESFNLGDIMVSNIMESRYFFIVLYVEKGCVLGSRDLTDIEEVINEIKREVHDLGSFFVVWF